MSARRESRPSASTEAAGDHHGNGIGRSLTQPRRCLVLIGYTLLVLLLAATLVVIG